MFRIRLEAGVGTYINEANDIARKLSIEVVFNFNGIESNSVIMDIVDKYDLQNSR